MNLARIEEYHPRAPADAGDIARLIAQTATAFMSSGLSRDGLNKLLEYASAENLALRSRRNCRLFLVRDKLGPAAVLELRDRTHIALLFVRVDHIGRGLGSHLLKTVKNRVGAAGVAALTVKATPLAVGFYSRHGFSPTGAITDRNGMRFLPMRCSLYRTWTRDK